MNAVPKKACIVLLFLFKAEVVNQPKDWMRE